ncbi:MAG: hypothetical protein ACLQIB_28670 [Isosphaeraceae bacterium]
MGWKERLFERPLSRAFDEELRRAIDAEFQRRRHEIPIPVRLTWGQGEPSFLLASQWASFLVSFAPNRLIVDAELSLAARMLATEKNRQSVINIINSIADDLNL